MRLLSVDQITAYITELFDADPILNDIWVRGEINHFTEARSGHCYFSLTDGECSLKCVLFRGNRTFVPKLPALGDSVVAHGRVGVYAARGEYQLYVDMVADDGVGLLQLEFERMRARLEAEGLFRPERKRALPAFPRVIGVVTSQDGAVWHDIQDVISRRFPLVELILAPSSVQGANAPAEVIEALRRLGNSGQCDVIIIARGGGSPEDLAPFNDEELARAIFSSPVPIISAVGHETDVTIADLVADLRAPTPSAAAEMVVPDRRAVKETLCARADTVRGRIKERLDEMGDHIQYQRHCLERLSPHSHIDNRRLAVDDLQRRAESAVARRLERTRSDIAHQSEMIRLLNPYTMLERGYVIVMSADGLRRILRADQARRERRLSIVYRDDEVTVDVVEDGRS